jgi:hypothetical protein
MARNVLACESDMSCRCACCLFCIEAFSHLGYASLQEKPLHFERFAVWLDSGTGALGCGSGIFVLALLCCATPSALARGTLSRFWCLRLVILAGDLVSISES